MGRHRRGPAGRHIAGSFSHAAEFQVIAALSAGALLTQVVEDYEPSLHRGRRSWFRRSLLGPGIAVGFVNVFYPVITGFLILHLARRSNAGSVAFSVYAGFVLLSRFFLGGLPDRLHPRTTFYLGLICMAIGLSILATGPNWTWAVIAAALLGFGYSFPWASIASTVLRRAHESERGSSVSVLSAFYDVFVGASSISAGFLANSFGYSAAFIMAIAALGAAAIAGRAVFAANDATAHEYSAAQFETATSASER
jgi:MFS family permease